MSIWWYVIPLFIVAGGFVGFRRTRRRPLTSDEQAEVQKEARQGNHVAAMRLYRKFSGASLREAKEAVEKLERSAQ